MENKKLTVDNLRQAIYEMADEELNEEVKSMSDADFLACDFYEDLLFDSLDMMCFALHLEKEHCLRIPPHFEEQILQKGNLVQTCLDLYNEQV